MTDTHDAARAEFERFDKDGDGLLTAAEIKQVNVALGPKGLSEAEIDVFVATADMDGDGRIGLEEFVALVGGGRHEQA
jgi:Ca2+-binding EF-hand superfamily protein